MKTFTLAVFLMCFTLSNAQTTNIPDSNFEQALIDLGFDTVLDGSVLTANINTITTLNVNSKNISNLTGIEDFTALETLVCYTNQLTSLNVSQNTNLVNLFCAINLLTNLDVSNNTALKNLSCFTNQLTGLDLTQNTLLTDLNCANNQITSLDINNNTDLLNLTCFTNQLTSLNTSLNTNLTSLLCAANQITGLDLSQNSNLTVLSCFSNQLQVLDIKNGTNNTISMANFNASNNPNLSCIEVDNVLYSTTYWTNIDPASSFSVSCQTYVPDNNFEQALIDLGYDTILDDYVTTSNINGVTSLSIINKNISDLTGIEDFTALQSLNCGNNNLSSLDVSYNPSLNILYCNNNNISSLDLSNNPSLKILSCFLNGLLTLNISNNALLESLDGYSNNLLTLDVTNNTALNFLRCNSNNLSSLDVSNNALLNHLTCSALNLSSLDVSNNSLLEVLSCGANNLTSLNLSNNPLLRNFDCNNNNISTLDLSNNLALIDFSCSLNNLTSLNIKNGNNINLNSFYATNNPNLTCIEVDNVPYSTANWTNIDPQTSFEADCNNIYTSIPDDNFEQALINLGYDTVLDNSVRTSNIYYITNLDISSRGIGDLTGLENFASLQNFNCASNLITNLDVSDKTALTTLNCSYNQLTSLNIQNNILLTNLECSNNGLSNLDTSFNTVLEDLNCNSNSLTSLDLSSNTALINLNVSSNPLTSLNIKNGTNTNIISFDATFNNNLTCIEVDDAAYSIANWTNIDPASSFNTNCHYYDTYVPDNNFEQALIDLGYDTVLDDYVTTSNINGVTSLSIINKNISDLTGIEDFIGLQQLQCNTNNLTSLNISNNTLLYNLNCSYNNISSLNISNNTLLYTLICSSNNISVLDVSNNTFLNVLACSSNNLTTLELSNNTQLRYLYCRSNQLSVLNVKNGNNTNVIDFEAANNPNLTCIEVDDATYSTTNWNNIDPASSFSNNCHYYDTYVPDNNFEQALIDLGYDTVLDDYVLTTNINTISYLDVSFKNITDLTGIEGFRDLEELRCYNNQITNLDVSQNSTLFILRCGVNQLTSLDVSQNGDLYDLRCHTNQLTTLNVKNGNNSSFTVFNATNNPNLTCIEVDDVAYSTTNWTNIDAQTAFSINCGMVTLEAKAYLQGASMNPNVGEENLMRDDLRIASLIPTTSPYADALTCNASVFTPTGANAIVDWIWIELRDENDNTNILASTSALLQRDGDVVATDGISPLSFNLPNNNYFVALSHRNHLGILSANTFALSSTVSVVDLSNSFAIINGGVNAVVDLGNGIFACYAGDFDGNDQIQNTDVNSVVSLLGNSGYSNADADLNGQTQNTDINNLINPNIGKGQQYARQQLNLYAKRRTN